MYPFAAYVKKLFQGGSQFVRDTGAGFEAWRVEILTALGILRLRPIRVRCSPTAVTRHSSHVEHEILPAPAFRNRRNSRGFTLIEVMLAGVVLVLALATSITTLQRGFSALDTARSTTLASQIMQSEIERIRLMPWNLPGGAVDSIEELPASETVPLVSMFSADPALAAKFTITRTVTADATRPTEVKHITLTATWKSYDGKTHSRTYSTMYTKKGLYDYYYVIAAP